MSASSVIVDLTRLRDAPGNAIALKQLRLPHPRSEENAMTHKRVLVAGATGRLGVVVNVLLDRGHTVRAMTRDPTSSTAARLRAAGASMLPIAHTILATVYFMENLVNPWNLAALQAGVLPSQIAVDLPLQQVASADVASIAALAVERPEEFAGRRIRVASDELTATDAADALARVAGRPFSVHRVAVGELGPGFAVAVRLARADRTRRRHSTPTLPLPAGRMAHIRGMAAL